MAKSLPLTVLMLLIMGAAGVCAGQIADASSSSPFPGPKEDVPQPILEQLAKMKSDDEKREFKELTDNGALASDLAAEILKNYGESRRFSDEDLRRIEKVERLIKKVRSGLGGSDSSESEKGVGLGDVTTVRDALEKMSGTAAALSDELRRCTRYSVSVGAIETSNRVLDLISVIKRLN